MINPAKRPATTLLGLILALALPEPSQAESPIRISVPSTQITGFCMGIRISRHPNFSGPMKKYRLKL